MYSRLMTNPLTNDALRRMAPSIFAEQAHESTSARYTYVPTLQIVEGMRNAGFAPVDAVQSRTRIEGKKEYTKHMIKFMNMAAAMNGQVAPQVLIVNSHDGSSSYKILAAMIRFICGNGLVVCDNKIAEVKVRHSGDIINNVIEGSFTVIDSAKEAASRALDWEGVSLSAGEREAFARAAITVRYSDNEETKAPITASQLLLPRRREDKGSDLWSTFNTVQENMIKGGLSYRTASGQRNSTRAVTGIDQNTGINRALWQLAEEMRTLKAA